MSSYLKAEDSNKVLSILTKTDFNDKIAAGVPKEVPVAHKIGVFGGKGELSQEVFSDCGIIYVPNRPYTLCIMTRGDDENIARQHMKNISQLVYGYVSQIDN